MLNRDFQVPTWLHTLHHGMVLRVFDANELCVCDITSDKPSLYSTVATAALRWKFIRWPMAECKYCLIMRPLSHIFVKLLLTRRFECWAPCFLELCFSGLNGHRFFF